MESSSIHLQLAGEGNELTGLRVLVVEDDYFVAVDMCSALMRRGAIILGPAGNVRRTRELLRQHLPDCVLLDLNLHGAPAFELAEDFQRAGIPTIFTTGYDSAFFPDELRGLPYLAKPIDFKALVAMIRTNAQATRS